jgi:hypothetical protein
MSEQISIFTPPRNPVANQSPATMTHTDSQVCAVRSVTGPPRTGVGRPTSRRHRVRLAIAIGIASGLGLGLRQRLCLRFGIAK